ncbi:hypothetical protein [Leucobacter sp. USHLN153]|uniref:hypothetical protein n=1 Tax=Leucobacter sp. USHLN153 TaxID=3081268 RepID=UPI0030188860
MSAHLTATRGPRENFFRAPSGPLDYLADALRVVGLLSVVGAAIWLLPTDAGVLALTLPALVAPRILGVRAGFDIVFSLVVLAAAWSNVIDLYRTVAWWDIVMHAVTMAVLVPLVYLLLARAGVVPPSSAPSSAPSSPPSVPGRPRKRVPLVLFPTLGLALGALWEMVEWAGFEWISDEIYVDYADTIGDLAVGGLGALAAGIALARLPLERE